MFLFYDFEVLYYSLLHLIIIILLFRFRAVTRERERKNNASLLIEMNLYKQT